MERKFTEFRESGLSLIRWILAVLHRVGVNVSIVMLWEKQSRHTRLFLRKPTATCFKMEKQLKPLYYHFKPPLVHYVHLWVFKRDNTDNTLVLVISPLLKSSWTCHLLSKGPGCHCSGSKTLNSASSVKTFREKSDE